MRLLPSAAAVVMLAALAACGADGDDVPEETDDSSARAVPVTDACSLLSLEDAGRIVGAVYTRALPTTGGGFVLCSYEGDGTTEGQAFTLDGNAGSFAQVATGLELIGEVEEAPVDVAGAGEAHDYNVGGDVPLRMVAAELDGVIYTVSAVAGLDGDAAEAAPRLLEAVLANAPTAP